MIMMSGYDEQEATLKLEELSGFIQKPFSRDDLTRKLRQTLRNRGQI